MLWPGDILSFPLLSDDFDDDPFGALPIEFAVEEARPAAKVDPAIGDRQDNLVMQHQVFEVGIAVVPGLSGDGDRRDVRVRVAGPIPWCRGGGRIPRTPMIIDAVRCMADTKARPSWTPLSRMMRGALVGDGDDVFAFLGMEGEVGGMGCAWDYSSSGGATINVWKVLSSSWKTILPPLEADLSLQRGLSRLLAWWLSMLGTTSTFITS
jgi:hypothetical protein